MKSVIKLLVVACAMVAMDDPAYVDSSCWWECDRLTGHCTWVCIAED